MHGWRPRGTGGRSPQNLRWGTAHASVHPIFWEVMFSDERESTKRVKNGVTKELFSDIGVFSLRKGHRCLYDISHSKDMENLKKDREKKSENHGRWLKNCHQTFWNLSLRIFSRPQPNSTPGLRLCSHGPDVTDRCPGKVNQGKQQLSIRLDYII